jgi:hypothetical protein
MIPYSYSSFLIALLCLIYYVEVTNRSLYAWPDSENSRAI